MTAVSVVIPVYNRADCIIRALDSVRSQTRPADEVIVIDDGSTDAGAGLVRANYPEFNLLSQHNGGVSAARNTGIRAAGSDWIALLDSDDEWLPEKLEHQMQALQENPDYLIVHSNEIWIRNGVRVNQMKKHRKTGGHIFQQCLPLCIISPSSVMIHRSLLAEVGLFDESLPVCEDYDMWLRICARYPVLFVDEALIIKYGGHADQLSGKYWGMDRYRIQAISKALSSERLSPADRTAAIAAMQEKIRIYLDGARKHQNNELVAEFRQLSRYYATGIDDRSHNSGMHNTHSI